VRDCFSKRTVTFTRTGDTDIASLTDPAGQPSRVVSPAEALHGRYHTEINIAGGSSQEYDVGVRTDCLRTGERCMSFFLGGSWFPLAFANGTWTENTAYEGTCPAGGTNHVIESAVFPLPQPPQDPITLLTGNGHQEVTGNTKCQSKNFDQKFVRTGD
jgi:hypothetical protein